jgi:hypothetical protein
LRAPDDRRKHPLTEATVTPEGDEDATVAKAGRSEDAAAGCAKRLAILSVFVFTLFEGVMEEGICGRFGRIGV